MKKILGLLLFFLIFILFGVYFSQNSGSVHLYIDSWKIQMPLWLVMLGLVCFYLFLFVLGKLLYSCWGALSFLGNIKQGLNTINVKDNLKKGLFSFIRGDFKTAERLLLKVTNIPKEKVSAALALVMIAEETDDSQKARDYLSFLKLQNTDDEDVDSLVRVMLALNVKNYQEAEYLLDGLAVTIPHNNRLLLLKKRLYLETKDIEKLQELLPLLKRYSTVGKEELAQLRNIVDTLSVDKLVKGNASFETWNNFWQGLTKEQQTRKLLKQFIVVCLENKEYQLAEPLIKSALNTEWDDQLIEDYGKLSEVDYKKQFAQGEKWLLLYPDNAPLLLTLAEIAIKLQLWGQAEHYLNRSIAIKPMSRAYFALAELQAHLDNNERKQRNYYIESAKLSLSSI